MQSNWKTHLESSGAVIEGDTVIHYGKSEAEFKKAFSTTESIITDLSHIGLIKISGSEAQSFLQSQFSNDVNLVTETQAQLNSYCSPKGRVLALFNLFKIDTEFYLQLPKNLLDSILKRLTMFKMRADVELVDVSDSTLCIGIAGNSAESILKTHFSKFPSSHFDSSTVNKASPNSVTIIRISTEPRFILFANSKTLTKFWTDTNNTLAPVGYDAWSLLDIHAGIPNITPETVEAFVPQMLNLQLINAVSFKKGCYPGQEIVARTQYLGKLKKRMYLLTSDYNQALIPGTDLSTENASDDQSKGKIVNCQLNPDGGIDALAVLQINSIEEGHIIVRNSPEVKFSIQTLPYSFDEPT